MSQQDVLYKKIVAILAEYLPGICDDGTLYDKLLMRDLGVDPNDYTDFLEEVGAVCKIEKPQLPHAKKKFGLLRLFSFFKASHVFFPPDLSINNIAEFARCRVWPAHYMVATKSGADLPE